MPDRRNSAQGKSKVETRQKTLLDLFPKKASIETHPVNNLKVGPSKPEPVVLTITDSERGTTLDRVELPKPQQKPLHPLFTKRSRPSNSVNEIQIVEDEIIEVPDDESSPSSLLPSGSPHAVSFERCSPHEPGGSQEDPIILESSPMRPPLPLPSQSPPFQFPIRPPFMSPVASRAKPSKDRNTDNVPYPDRNSQHIRGPQQMYSAPNAPYSRRQQRRATVFASHLSMLHLNQDMNDIVLPTDTMDFLPCTAAGKETYLEEIPSEHSRLHPAILRPVNPDASRPTGSSSVHNWTDKWRPTRAEEVLGNESNAIYLRDWLSALELHFDVNSTVKTKQTQKTDGTTKAGGENIRSNKRLRVLRAVEKHRGRKKRRIDSDDWIVYSDESEEEVLQADVIDDDIEQAPSRLYHRHSRSDLAVSALPNQFSNHLTNTILLAGPSGAGKTAAIYACADELGWEVFEVYPGIGKRNGASIENMIGDVGKNHLVRKTQYRGEAIRTSEGRAIFSGRGKDPADEQPQDCHSLARDFGFISRSNDQLGQGAGKSSTVRQSLILLEEVDILFKEDNNFWPTVTSFIKDCKRPVICTCNDISLVPTLELPLQTILTFQACPAQVATSYLQVLCSAEGYLVERDSLLRLYDSTCKSANIPLSSSARVDDLPVPDLRRTINCLQLRCSTMGAIPSSGCIVQWHTEPEHSVECFSYWSQTQQPSPIVSPTNDEFPLSRGLVIDHADLVSFVDSELVQSDFEVSEAFDGFEPSADDEVGHTKLLDAVPTIGNLFKFRHDDIAMTAMRLSREVLERGIKKGLSFEVVNGPRTRALFRARVEHQVQMVEGLKNMIPLSAWAMRNDVIHMDYGPWIRQLIAEEDMQEALDMKKERSGRTTRNSGGGYVRTILVTADERKALVATRLVG